MEFIRITKVQGVGFEKGRSQTRVSGALHLTSHHLLFVPGENEPGQEVWICYSTIHSVDKKSPTPEGHWPLYIACRNFAFVRVFIRREQECNEVYATLQRLMNITSVESLFAFYYTPVVPFTSSDGWNVYDPKKEFARQGLGRLTDQWRFSDINENYEFSPTYPRVLVVPAKISDAVLNYAVKFRSKGRLPALSYIHRKNQISITRASQPLSGLAAKRSLQDEKLVECIFTSGSSPSSNNLIVDARPSVNAMANSVTGAGIESTENYRNCRLTFSGIDNIHVVRDSFNRVLDAIEDCRGPLPVDKLERSGWLRHVRNILDATLTIVQSVHLFNAHVLIHCSDGWDRTSQLASLAMLCLDPYYRTMEGFAVLVEKEWVSFGHKFAIRSGHLSRDEKSKVADDIDSALPDFGPSTATALRSQLSSAAKSASSFFRQQVSSVTGQPARSPSPSHHRDSSETVHSSIPNSTAPKDIAPVFTQFLDCVYQIWRQFPTHFEFSDRFLVQLNTHLYSCQFGNFLFNNERERSSYRDAHGKPIEKCTSSVWDWFASQNKPDFANEAYVPPGNRSVAQGAQLGGGRWNVADDDEEVLFPQTKDTNQRELLEFWRTLFLRSDNIVDGMEQVDRGPSSSGDVAGSDADLSSVRELQSSPISRPVSQSSSSAPVEPAASERSFIRDIANALADTVLAPKPEPATPKPARPLPGDDFNPWAAADAGAAATASATFPAPKSAASLPSPEGPKHSIDVNGSDEPKANGEPPAIPPPVTQSTPEPPKPAPGILPNDAAPVAPPQPAAPPPAVLARSATPPVDWHPLL